MKRIILILMLFGINQVIIAQEGITLKEFDTPPALHPYKWIKGTPVDDFSKGKVYVVEFGATWCKPCAALIPVLAEISSKYKDVAVISNYVMEYITPGDNGDKPKYVDVVEKYITKHGDQINYSVAVDDRQKTLEKAWLKAAGKAGIPNVFIIDKNGKIAWIGSNPQELKKMVELVAGSSYDMKALQKVSEEKKSAAVKYDQTKLLLIDGNGGADTSFLFRSVLSVYKGDIDANGPRFITTLFDNPWVNSKSVIQCTGIGITALYKLAYSDTLYSGVLDRSQVTNLFNDTTDPRFKRSYGRYWYYPVLEVKDSTPFMSNFQSPANRFNYSLKIPENKTTAAFLQECMRLDLKKYFGYEVVVERRKMPYWQLTISDKAKNALVTKTAGSAFRQEEDANGNFVLKNAEIRDIISDLELRYGYTMSDAMTPKPHKQPPFIDATGIMGEIDFVMFKEQSDKILESDASVDTFEIYREILRRNGIEMVKGTKEMNVVVIRDAH